MQLLQLALHFQYLYLSGSSATVCALRPRHRIPSAKMLLRLLRPVASDVIHDAGDQLTNDGSSCLNAANVAPMSSYAGEADLQLSAPSQALWCRSDSCPPLLLRNLATEANLACRCLYLCGCFSSGMRSRNSSRPLFTIAVSSPLPLCTIASVAARGSIAFSNLHSTFDTSTVLTLLSTSALRRRRQRGPYDRVLIKKHLSN